MLSIMAGVTLSLLLNPNPQRLINGAQVISVAYTHLFFVNKKLDEIDLNELTVIPG